MNQTMQQAELKKRKKIKKKISTQRRKDAKAAKFFVLQAHDCLFVSTTQDCTFTKSVEAHHTLIQLSFAPFASLRDVHGCTSAAMAGRHEAALCVEGFWSQA